jgi:hypothetical protein
MRPWPAWSHLALRLDEAGTYRDNAVQAYDYLTRSYFNDAAKALSEMNEEACLGGLPKFKEATLLATQRRTCGPRRSSS